MKELFMLIWLILFIAWLLWLVIYPIYSKIKRKYVKWDIYAIVLIVATLIINVFNAIIQMAS